MRTVAVVLAASLICGCATNSYRIPPAELARLAQTAPEARGGQVRVVQDIANSDVPAASPVTEETQVVFVPNLSIGYSPRGSWHRGGGGGGSIGHIGGGGSDGKGAAIVFLVIAASALITAAIVEGSRFDGYARLHPMHPVHLIGKDGGYTVMPLAWIDPQTAAWADRAVVRRNEGPFLELERAPLDRQGMSYAMYGGTGSLRSADGDLKFGPAWTVQLGGFFTQRLGLFASVFFGWRDNKYNATLFENRYTAELQYFPVQLGILHLGLYGGGGVALRFEDAVKLAGRPVAGNENTGALVGGAMLQLDVNTRIALTARLGLAAAHEEQMQDVLFGIAVY